MIFFLDFDYNIDLGFDLDFHFDLDPKIKFEHLLFDTGEWETISCPSWSNPDPLNFVVNGKKFIDKYKVGEQYDATIGRVMDYGAFAHLEEGLSGLIHQSQISHTKKNIHP